MAEAPPVPGAPPGPPAMPLAERLALAFGARDRLAALVALAEVEHEIHSSARRGLDHGVAHARLEWWRGEIERLAAGAPRHPAARRLLEAAGAAPDYARLADLLTCAEMALLGYAPAGREELLAHLDRRHGSLELLRAEILAGERHPALSEWTRALGRGLGLAQALDAADATILGAVDAAELRRLALEELTSACALPAALPGALRARQAHGLIRARLACATLERPGGPPAALRQCWLAWRTARRALGSVP